MAFLGRRDFLMNGLLFGLVPGGVACERQPRELWVSAAGGKPAEFGAGWTDAEGHSTKVLTGFRGHDVLLHPLHPERIVLVARRPGQELVEVDVAERRVRRRVRCSERYELGGHACFSLDGRTLFTAESDYEQGEGRVVVRDAEDYRTLCEFPSRGVGPHEIIMMPDGRLAVANGGLRTHPDSEREVLNLDTMRSSLVFLESRTGELLEEHRLDEPKASIRHLDVTSDGRLSVALQMQREGSGHENLAPLAALYDDQRGLRALSAPDGLLWQCSDYMGSTRINEKTRVAGFTSPRGDIALFWNLDTHEFLACHRFHDVCGIAVSLDQNFFILSNSAGQLRCLDARTLEEVPERRLELAQLAWDNHLRALLLPG